MHRKAIPRALLTVPAAATALALGLVPAQAAATSGWRRVAVVSAPGTVTFLDGVAAGNASHAWAVGFQAPASGTTQPVPIVEAGTGSTWSQVSLPAQVLSKLSQDPLLGTVAASGPGNTWAFTELGNWLHYNGSTWTAGRISRNPVGVSSSLAFGTNTAWAFGGTFGARTTAPYAARITGSNGWKRTPVPGTGTIADASAVTSRDIWAVISSAVGGSSDSLVHWYAGRWHKVSSLAAALRHASLRSVLARSDKNVWVGGSVKNSKGGTTELVGHWNGHRWAVHVLGGRATAARYGLVDMVGDGSGGIWAVGLCRAKCPASPTRLWHQKAGRWVGPVQPKLASQPTVLIDLALAGHSVLGAGAIRAGASGANGLIALWTP